MNYKANSEEALAIKISDYLKTQYPDVIFHFDYGSGLKMTKGQAIRQKRLNKYRGYPDLFIAEPRTVVLGESKFDDVIVYYSGLYLEIKKEGTRLKKKNGEWASEHVAEQAKMLEALEDKDYKAEFAVGFEKAKEIIDKYLKNN